jgi:CcmD family protein
MENGGYLLAAYTIIWAVVFGYVFLMWRKQRKLRQQMDGLRQAADKLKTDDQKLK